MTLIKVGMHLISLQSWVKIFTEPNDLSSPAWHAFEYGTHLEIVFRSFAMKAYAGNCRSYDYNRSINFLLIPIYLRVQQHFENDNCRVNFISKDFCFGFALGSAINSRLPNGSHLTSWREIWILLTYFTQNELKT